MSRARSQRSKKILWPEAARKVAALLALDRFPAAVRRELAETAVGKGKDPWAIAFSGGADSLALLLALAGHFPERQWLALHFNHRLRGVESTGDARFCAGVCRGLAMRFIVGRAERPKLLARNEEVARNARFAFFEAVMGLQGVSRLALGHHRDDVAETVLLRLSRGAGLAGLAAPRARQLRSNGTTRLRPLLDFSKAEIHAALRAAGVEWREDRSNHTDAYFRNRLRRAVLPAWSRAVPADVNLATAIGRSRAQLEEDDEALEGWAVRVASELETAGGAIEGWSALPPAIVRRALHCWWRARQPGGELARAVTDQLVATIRDSRSGRFSVGAAQFVVINGGRLALESASAMNAEPKALPAGRLDVPGSWVDAAGGELHAALVPATQRRNWRQLVSQADIGNRVFLGSAMKQPEPLLVRSWQPGDRYQAFGSSHVSKLQDQFINRRIPRDERHRLPVICRADGAILWVPGIPPAEGSRVTPASRSLVQLTYHPPHPRSHPQDV